jgi:hypothetical protein
MSPQPESSTQEVLAGLIERVTYHNAENGFCVLRTKARGHRDVGTVVGHAAVNEGHCGLPVPLAEKLLEASQPLIRTALDLELQESTVIAEK